MARRRNPRDKWPYIPERQYGMDPDYDPMEAQRSRRASTVKWPKRIGALTRTTLKSESGRAVKVVYESPERFGDDADAARHVWVSYHSRADGRGGRSSPGWMVTATTSDGYSSETLDEGVRGSEKGALKLAKRYVKEWHGGPRRRKNAGRYYQSSGSWPRRIGKLSRRGPSLSKATYVTDGASLTVEHVPHPGGGGPNIGGYWVEMRVGNTVAAMDLRKTKSGALSLAQRYARKYSI